MRIYNPIFPSIKDNLEELFGKAPTSITLTSYSAQYSIADQGTCKIKGYVYPQDAVNQQVLITYTSQKEGSILTYSINYGEDSTGKYFEISVSTTTEDVYSITVKAKGNSSVQADVFTLTAISEVPITSVSITKTTPSDFEMTVGEDVILTVSIVPSNYTENIQIHGTIDDIINEDWDITKTASNGYQLTYNTVEPGTFDFGAIVRNESGRNIAQKSFAITVKKAITPMTDSEITAHLSKRRYQNLVNYFESFDELSEFVQAKDYHDIYIGDYIPIAIPFTHSSNGSTTQSGSYAVNFRVVDINYLLDKTAASVSSQHLVLMPDNPIGECAMTKGENQYQDELVEVSSSGWYPVQGRGYYNNNMTLNALPRILTSLKAQFGSSHILNFNDSVPIYYSSNSWGGGYMTQVTYQAAPNTQIRLPTLMTMDGRTLADSNAVWTQQFRLYQTDTNYQYTRKPAISGTQGSSGCLLTDLYSLEQGNSYPSTMDLLIYRIQNGGGGRFTSDYSEGPVCPIIIFG